MCIYLRYVLDQDMVEPDPDEGLPLPGVGVWACPAFPWPRGIPDKIFYGDDLHLTPWPNQVGVMICTPGESDPFGPWPGEY